MDKPRKNPHIYEINSMTWLRSLGKREKRPINLGNIPRKEWKYLKELGMDIIWLMGIWQRSPYSTESIKKQPKLLDVYGEILNDLSMEDIEGSAYSIYDYCPEPSLGTFQDLLDLKKILEEEGLWLVLDFVPNHTSCDHPWTTKYPERYIMDKEFDREECREGFFMVNNGDKKYCLAHGRDPYFPPWNDTAQINYGNDNTINAMTDLICRLSDYCHGFRCDMAMLPLKDVFQMTWGEYLQDIAEVRDFWPYAIDRIRSRGNLCILIAEAYWGKEKVLLDMGFDYAYDKYLYDLIVHGDIQGIKKHLSLSR
ncbi:MAG: alpha-amylase, partial [Deltaproteobacteria bacterium]|nr:alpha-amylase [Deltaproteobacteria bacterium]